MQTDPKSKLLRQVVLFAIVFAAAFFGTRYLAKTYLKKEKTAAEQGSPKP